MFSLILNLIASAVNKIDSRLTETEVQMGSFLKFHNSMEKRHSELLGDDLKGRVELLEMKIKDIKMDMASIGKENRFVFIRIQFF